jgi:hypothetical protein
MHNTLQKTEYSYTCIHYDGDWPWEYVCAVPRRTTLLRSRVGCKENDNVLARRALTFVSSTIGCSRRNVTLHTVDGQGNNNKGWYSLMRCSILHTTHASVLYVHTSRRGIVEHSETKRRPLWKASYGDTSSRHSASIAPLHHIPRSLLRLGERNGEERYRDEPCLGCLHVNHQRR